MSSLEAERMSVALRSGGDILFGDLVDRRGLVRVGGGGALAGVAFLWCKAAAGGVHAFDSCVVSVLASFAVVFSSFIVVWKRAWDAERGRWGSRVVPSPFSISGMGATLFLVCSRVDWYLLVSSLRWTMVDEGTYVSRGAVDSVLADLDGAVV